MTAARRKASVRDPVWHVRDDDPFISAQRIPPGRDPATISRFGDDRWDLSPLQTRHHAGAVSANWATFPEPLRDSFRRAGWALMNLPTPEELLERANTARVKWPSPGSQETMVGYWRAFAVWLHARGFESLSDVDQDVLTDYALHVSATLPAQRAVSFLYSCTLLWGYAPHLLKPDRLAMPPWEAGELKDFISGGGVLAENTTEPVHPAVMSPLLIWAIRFVEVFADDIIAAWQEHQRIAAKVPPRTRRGTPGGQANPEALEPLKALLHRHRAEGIPLPGERLKNGTVRVSVLYLAGLHATNEQQVSNLLVRFGTGLAVSADTPLATPIKGMLHGRPWKPHINFAEAPALMRRLTAASMIVICYLSGPRPGEVLELKVGCCPEPVDDGSGSVHYELHGNFFKDAYDENGRLLPQGAPRDIPWTTILPVVHAVRVLERVATGELLLPIVEPWTLLGRGAAKRQGEALSATAANFRIDVFIAWVNTYAHAQGNDIECIPADPLGAVVISRFRRTVAWHIARLPGGRVALSIQYGHLRSLVGERYSSRGRSGLAKALDLETARAIADFLHDVAERVANGEGVSGPAAGRMIQAIRDARIRFGGKFLTPRQLKDLLEEPQFQVFDNPDAFLACNNDHSKALCHEENVRRGSRNLPPAVERCDPACANIARTDQHIAALRAEIGRLTAEADDPLTPQPLAERLNQRIAKLARLAERHEATRIVPGHGDV